MQYFGVPTCPYCKKRVNLIRTWSLKRQGEYRCPRCGGISNIYLSPLVYVFALVAVFAGVAIYFFHKFILDDITLTTGIQVIIPFAVFFLLSLFMVYLAKPVIKKVPRAQVDRKRRNKGNFEERRMPAGRQGQTGQIFYDGEDYQPHTNYRAGPMPQEQGDEDMKIVEPRESRPAYGETSVQRTVMAAPREEIASQRPRVQAEASHTPAAAPRAPQRQTVQAPARPVQPAAQAAAPAKPAAAAVSPAQPAARPRASAPVRAQAPAPAAPRQAAAAPVQRAVQPAVQAAVPAKPAAQQPRAEQSKAQDDFFAKYDDPEYINRRLAELKREREQQGKQ